MIKLETGKRKHDNTTPLPDYHICFYIMEIFFLKNSVCGFWGESGELYGRNNRLLAFNITNAWTSTIYTFIAGS